MPVPNIPSALLGASLAKPIESSSESDGILEQIIQFGGVQLSTGGGGVDTGQDASALAPGGRGDSSNEPAGFVAQFTPLIFGLAIIIGVIKVFGKR